MVKSQLKIKGTPSSALLGATLGFFFGVMAISLFGPTSTTLGAAMGLGATELCLLVSVPSLTGSLLRIPFGAMVDTNGGRRGFLFLLAAAVLGLGALSILFTLYPVETPGSMTAQGGLSVAGRCRCLTKDSNTSIEKEGYIPYSLQA